MKRLTDFLSQLCNDATNKLYELQEVEMISELYGKDSVKDILSLPISKVSEAYDQ